METDGRLEVPVEREMQVLLERILGVCVADWSGVVEMELDKIRSRLDILEASPPQADMVQSVVRPPDAGSYGGESGRPPDRETIAKLVLHIKNCLWGIDQDCVPAHNQGTFDYYCKQIHEHLDGLNRA